MEKKQNQGCTPNNDYDPTQHEYFDADTHDVTPCSHRTKVLAQILLTLIILAFATLIWYNWKEFSMFFL